MTKRSTLLLSHFLCHHIQVVPEWVEHTSYVWIISNLWVAQANIIDKVINEFAENKLIFKINFFYKLIHINELINILYIDISITI